MEDLDFRERRACQRFPIKIVFKYFDLNLMQEGYAQTQDISAKGLSFLSSTEMLADTPLDIWLEMPDDGEQIYVKAKTVWSAKVDPDRYRVGVQLENIELNPIYLALKAIQVRIRQY